MGFRLARIARHRFHSTARFAYQCRRLRQLVRPPRAQDYRRALFCQQQGCCPANARRRADDSGNFVVQVQYLVLHGFSFCYPSLVTGEL